MFFRFFAPYRYLFYKRSNIQEKKDKLTQDEWIDVYKIALESFIPENGIADIDYIAIDLNAKFYDKISDKGKQETLNYFKKYDVQVFNASADTLKQKGLANEYGELFYNGKEGILLEIEQIDSVSDSLVVMSGYWYVGLIAARGATTYINFKNGEWILRNRFWTWIS